jgi:hypothetical protein
MFLVILESPFAGKGETEIERLVNQEANIHYAHQCIRDSCLRGEAPIASHVLYTQALDDTDPEERKLGIAAGLAWRKHADYSVFYIDRGWSRGMLAAYDSLDVEGGGSFMIRSLNCDLSTQEILDEMNVADKLLTDELLRQ